MLPMVFSHSTGDVTCRVRIACREKDTEHKLTESIKIILSIL